MDLRRWSVFSLLGPDFMTKIKIACIFGDAGNEVLVVTNDNEVYGFGPNTAGCLGLSHQLSCLKPKLVTNLAGKLVKDFAFGSGPHVVAFTEEGEVYSWGHNGYCELGRGTCSPNQVLVPGLITGAIAGNRIVQVACGKYHTLALSDTGEVFAWGQNNFGQVGSGLTSNQSSPRKVTTGLDGKIVKKVICGNVSSFAVLLSGEVFGWGYNGTGQLGIGNTSNQLIPLRINTLSGKVIINLVCGFSHTLALSDSGDLYGWGSNGCGQLGTGDKSNSSTPVRITINLKSSKIVDIAAIHYSNISAAITENCNVYMWGTCKGQAVLEPTLTPFNSLHEVFACFSDPAVSYRPIISKIQTETAADMIAKAFDNPECSDLTITVQGKPIRVHKSILRLRCQYFKTMFQDHFKENSQDVLEIDRSSYPVYRAFLQYLYTDKVNLPPEDALELLDLAAEYCESPLKQLCEQIIKHGIAVENTASLYAAAITLQAEDLEDFCLSFSLNHMTAVVQSAGFLKLDEKIMKNFILEASKRGAFIS